MPLIQVRNRITSPNHNKLSGPAYNVMHVFAPTGYTIADVQAALADMATFYTALAAYYRSGATITVGERVLDVDQSPDVIVGTTPVNVTNASGPSSLPPEVAAVVSWRTNLTGARYRGRTYIGPLAVAAIATGGEFFSTFVTTLQTAANTLLANLNANTPPTPFQIRSRKFGTATSVLAAVVDDEPDTQRRRGG
jgi:hypothetical protein